MRKHEKPLTPMQIAAVKDNDVDLSDFPELDDDFWRNAELVEPDRTEQATVRVKRSVLAKKVGETLTMRLACGVR